jgi:glucose/arabinose dehydrogenase
VRRLFLAGIVAAALAGIVTGCGSGGGSTVIEPVSSTVAMTSNGASPRPAGGRERVKLIVPSSLRGGELSASHDLSVPKGWKASVWARPQGARMEAITPEGNLLVSEPGNDAVIELGGAKVAEREKVVLGGLESPQGLAFAKRGGRWVLYVGESDQIDAFPWRGHGKVGAQKVLAPNLPDEQPAGDDIHRQKDVVVAPDGRIYFDVGSSSNASPADRGYDPPRG